MTVFIIPVLTISLVAVSAIALLSFSYPYLYISLFWLLYFTFLTWNAKKSGYKAIWFNLSFIILVFALIEIYSTLSLHGWIQGFKFEGSYTQNYFTADDILGYAPNKGITVNSKLSIKGKQYYDVAYTINDKGLRISPPSDRHRCVLFFGDSFTFGEGLEDNETLPYLVGELSKAQVYNFGFHGYGPHQMLAAIEQGMLDKIVDCQPSLIAYEGFIGDIYRSAGRAPWDRHGPKYAIAANGTVKYQGHFDDNFTKSKAIAFIKEQVEKSYFYKKFFKYNVLIDGKDIKLFVEIVNASYARLREKYPNADFHVLFWDNYPENKLSKQVIAGLSSKSFQLDLISQILPNFWENESRYEIPDEQHPNALANQYIAEYMVEEIMDVSR